MANKTYQNFVLEAKIEDMYNTHVAMNEYLTVDDTLETVAGDKKVINVYTATGNVEEVTQGNGNTGNIEATFEPEEYVVGKTQGRGVYYDEEVDKDPQVIEVVIEGLAAKMANDHTSKVITEYGKACLWEIYTTPDFGSFANAIARMNLETEENLFAFICPADVAAVRKALKDDLKYAEAFVRTGYIGTVCGVPLIINKAVTAGNIYIATRKAVKLFNKRGMEVETDRDIDLRKNTIINRKTCVVALADATKAVRMRKYPTSLITTGLAVKSVASDTTGSTVLTVGAAPTGFSWAYIAGASAGAATLGSAVSGYTDITAESTTIAMSANTHLTVVLIDAEDKPVAKVDLTGDTLKIGA